MNKLSKVLIVLSLSLLIIGALGCDKNTESTTDRDAWGISVYGEDYWWNKIGESSRNGLWQLHQQDIAKQSQSEMAISNFLNDSHVNNVLWEEWNIFDEYSASVSLSDWKQQSVLRCALRERAVKNMQQLQSITAPTALKGFWTTLAGTVPFDPRNSNTWQGALGYYLAGTSICVGSGGDLILDTYILKQSLDKNMQAWLSLKNTCRQYDIKMEWPVPRTPQWPESNNPTPHY